MFFFSFRESGVRNLRKHIEKIYRKAAFKVNLFYNLNNQFFKPTSYESAFLILFHRIGILYCLERQDVGYEVSVLLHSVQCVLYTVYL